MFGDLPQSVIINPTISTFIWGQKVAISGKSFYGSLVIVSLPPGGGVVEFSINFVFLTSTDILGTQHVHITLVVKIYFKYKILYIKLLV